MEILLAGAHRAIGYLSIITVRYLTVFFLGTLCWVLGFEGLQRFQQVFCRAKRAEWLSVARI